MDDLDTSITLLERLRSSADREAWDRFVALYAPVLRQWALRAGVPVQDADDFVQSLFIVLLKKLPAFRYDPARGSFRGWLKTIVVHECCDWHQSRRAAPLDPSAAEALADSAEAFWEEEYRQLLVARVHEILQAEFQPNSWQAFLAWVHGNRTAEAVGADFGMSGPAVMMAVYRIRRRLRQHLEGLLD